MKFEIKQYLFEPLTRTKAWFLGYDIYQMLPKYEPRIRLTNVSVVPHSDKGFYEIVLDISIPNVSGKNFRIASILSS